MSILTHFSPRAASNDTASSVTAPTPAAVPSVLDDSDDEVIILNHVVNALDQDAAAVPGPGGAQQSNIDNNGDNDEEDEDEDNGEDAHSIITISSDSDDDDHVNTTSAGVGAGTVANNPTVAAHLAGIMGMPQVNTLPAFVVFSSPWIGGRAYGVVPPVDLVCDNAIYSSDWYLIYSGRWVGVVAVQPLAHAATNGVSGSLYRWFGTQEAAIDAFNTSRALGVIKVL